MLLCFLGVRSLKLAAGCAGFGLGSGLAAALGGGPIIAFLVGAAGAVGAVLLVALAARVGAFAVGGLGGGVIAASVYRSLPPDVNWHPALFTLAVLAVALLCGAMAQYLRGPLLRAITALAGAGLIVRGVVEAGPAFLGFLRDPITWVESLVALAVLLALGWAGFTAQRNRAEASRT
jgi:hypothetical protein